MVELPAGWKRRQPQRRSLETFPPIKAEHAEAIGRLVTNWSLVEGAMAGCAQALLGLDGELAWAVTAEMSGAALYNLIHALLWATREQEWVDEWRDVAATFDGLRNARNDVIHSEWMVVEPSHWALRTTRKDIVQFKGGEFSTEKIKCLNEDVLDFIGVVDAFLHNVCYPANSLRGKSSEKPPLVRGQSRKAVELEQARLEKKSKKDRDRAASKARSHRTDDALQSRKSDEDVS